MKYTEATRILKALVDGRDPTSDKPLPADSVLHNVSVMRAVLLGHEALQSSADRQKRREALPARVGTTWTNEEEQKLVAAWKKTRDLEALASSHGRTVKSIESRLERLGLITAAQRTTFAFPPTRPSVADRGPQAGAPAKRGRPRGSGRRGRTGAT
jgi:hypothetical protein